MSIDDPKNDCEQFLIHRKVALSCELERAERAHLQRLRSNIDNAEENAHAVVNAIGERLLHDPAGHFSLYGILPANRTKLLKTSGNGEVPDENKPSELVKTLESSATGCVWLRSHWEVLKARLEDAPNHWQSIDRFTAFRLLSRQPVEGMVDYRVAEIFVASHVIRPVGKSAFEDLLSDMTTSQLVEFEKELRARYPELKSIREPADGRELLLDLCEWKIEELNEKLAEYEENSDAIAEAKFNNLGTDETPDGRSARLYYLKCQSAFSRAEELLTKHQGKKKAEEERGYREPRRVEDYSRWPQDRVRRTPKVARPDVPVADEEIDISWAYEPYPGEQVSEVAPGALLTGEGHGEGPRLPLSTAEIQGGEFPLPLPTGESQAEGHRLPLSTAEVLGEEFQTLEPECHSPAGDEAGHSQEDSAVEAMEEPCDGMTKQGEKTENVWNEPKSDEDALIAKSQIIVGVTANSGVKSGLDSFGSFQDFGGALGLGETCSGLGVATEENGGAGSVSAGAKPEPRIPKFKTERANPERRTPPNVKPQTRKGERHARNSEWEAKRLKQKRARKELERSFEERIKVGAVLDRKMIMEIVRSAGEVSESPLPGLPPPPS